MEFSAGEKVFFITDLLNETLFEGYLLRPIFPQDPGQFWSITTDVGVKDSFLNPDNNQLDENYFSGLDSVKNIRVKFILEYSKNTLKRWNSFIKYLKTPFVFKYLNYQSEVFYFLENKNSKLKLFFKSIIKVISKPINIFINVGLAGLFRLVFGGFIDYFTNLNRIYALKKQIVELNKNEYLQEYMQGIARFDPDDEKLIKLKNELQELETKRFDIYNTIIAIIISVISLIISIFSK